MLSIALSGLTQSGLYLQKEKAEAVAEVVALKQKCDKLERYARTLTGQRKEMDKEIQRLNEVNIHHSNLCPFQILPQVFRELS